MFTYMYLDSVLNNFSEEEICQTAVLEILGPHYVIVCMFVCGYWVATDICAAS